MRRPGTNIGPYVLQATLGVGGMGEVYRAVAPDGSTVAIKVVRADLVGQPEVRRRFMREARAAAKLEHPQICQLLDFGVDGGHFYLVMEYVGGGSCAAWRDTPPDGRTLLRLFDQILAALAYAHARGVIHRDLKPENVLLDFSADGSLTAKVVDFGVVHFRDEEQQDAPGAHRLIGTPAYMSPEQALKLADVSPATDLYAVGIMLFELLTGARPFLGESAAATVMAHVNTPIPPLRLRPGLSSEGDLEGVIHHLLAKEPTDRYLFAIDARRALDKVVLTGQAEHRWEASGAFPETDGTDSDAETLRPMPTDPSAAHEAVEPDSPFRLFSLRDPPFLGRITETERVLDAARSVLRTGRPRVVLIEGEMGVGKTRLVTNAREQLEEEGLMQTWRGPFDGRAPGPDVGVAHALRRGLGLLGLTAAEVSHRIEVLLSRHDVGPRETAAMVELLGPAEGKAIGPLQLDSDVARWALVERVLARASQQRPVMLVLTDVHLSDGSPLRMARWLLEAPPKKRPWLLVMTFRPESVRVEGPFSSSMGALLQARRPDVELLTLGRMGLRALQEIVRSCVPLEPGLADVIAMRAAGNPMFAIELVRHLVDSGRLEGYGEEPSPAELLRDLPDAVGVLLRRRVEEAGVGPETDAHTIEVWERIAALGLRVPVGLALVHVADLGWADPATAFERALNAAISNGILLEDHEGTFRFESGLMRDALLERVAERGLAAEIQRSAGDAKVRHWSQDLEPHAMEIGRHYELGNQLDLAVEFYWRAAAYARATSRYSTCLEAYEAIERAVDIGIADASTHRLRALLSRGDAFLQLARFGDAAKCATMASRYADASGKANPAEALRLLAEVSRHRGDTREARSLYESARSAFGRAGGRAGQAWTAMGLARLELQDNQLQAAEQHLRAARDAFDEAGDTAGEATALRELGRTAFRTGLLEEARSLTEAARAGSERLGDRQGAALCTTTLGEVARALGDPAAAIELFEAARDELTAVGDWHGAAVATLAMGVTTRETDQQEAAREHLLEALAAFEEMGDRQYLAIVGLALGALDAEADRWDLADPRLRATLERDRRERIDHASFVTMLVDLGRTALFAGRNALAKELLITANYKLGRIAAESPLYDRVDEVQYLLSELQDAETDLDESTAVVDLFADDDLTGDE